MCENNKAICMCKIRGLQNVKMTQKNTYYSYINYMSFLLIMFGFEICMIYILIKFVELSWCNFQ